MNGIVIITEGGRLRIAADVPIPNAPGGQWCPMRIKALLRDIETHIEANENADSVPRKPYVKSGLVIDDGAET